MVGRPPLRGVVPPYELRALCHLIHRGSQAANDEPLTLTKTASNGYD